MNEHKVISLLSICQKAGLLKSGEFSCEKAFQSKQVKLCIIATDASDNTKKKFTNKSFFYDVPCLICFTKSELSCAIGKENRATIVITDSNLSSKIQLLLEKYTKLES